MNLRPSLAQRPLIIGGMHRSGTSLTASLLAGAGLDLGPALLGPNDFNPTGHFEDLGFYEFHRRALVAQGICSEGYTATGRCTVPAALAAEADAILADRMRPNIAWGWKEPRTVLFLDFWQERIPDARHLFVFRTPWDVADSLFRRGDHAFLANPAFALAVWTHYNQAILDFVRRHPGHCAVFELSQVVADPERVISTVRSRLHVPVGRPAHTFRDSLLTTDTGVARAAIVRATAPEAWRTYLELRELAGAEDAGDAAARGSVPLGDCAILEWARASRAEAGARQAAAREAAVRETAAPPAAEPPARPRSPGASSLRRMPASLVAGLAAVSRRLLDGSHRRRDAAPPVVRRFPPRAPAHACNRAA